MTATISRWGNSLGIRIPKAALEEAHLTEGDRVTVVCQDGNLVLIKATRQSLDELVGLITDENRHGEAFPTLEGRERW